MHLCILTGAIWVIGSGVLALVEIPVVRLYRWRLVFWLLLLLPFAVYRISVSTWSGTC